MSVPTIRAATPDDIPVTAAMVQELLSEIMAETGLNAFETDHATTERLLTSYIETGSYIVFVAIVEGGPPAGFIGLTPCRSLYANGDFGIIPELYVRKSFRSCGLGHALVEAGKEYGARLGWKRLEVTTPPIPPFGRTERFYRSSGFVVTGGYKMKIVL